MIKTICGIPVTVGAGLSPAETEKVVSDIARDWAWDGRQLGKVELISDGRFVHVCSYEKPVVTVILRKRARRGSR